MKRRLIFVSVLLVVGAIGFVVHQRRQTAKAAACRREAEKLAATRGFAETVYGGDALLVENGKILMRDPQGAIQRVEEDVFARQLGQGWKPAAAADVLADDVAVCMTR